MERLTFGAPIPTAGGGRRRRRPIVSIVCGGGDGDSDTRRS